MTLPAGADDDVFAGRVAGIGRDPRGTGSEVSVEVRPGPLGAMLVIDGVPLSELGPGARLRVGSAVVLELGGPEAAPSGTAAARAGLVDASSGARLRARVLDGGEVRLGDRVRLEAVRVPIQDALDLHSFRPGEVTAVVAEYLEEARAAGLGEVRLIHGRGRGVQRAALRRLLAEAPGVIGFADAAADRGGWGATVVRLGPTGSQRPG